MKKLMMIILASTLSISASAGLPSLDDDVLPPPSEGGTTFRVVLHFKNLKITKE